MTDVSDQSTYYIVIGWILAVLVLLAVLTRLYSRIWLTRSPGSDGFVITIATVSIYRMIETSDLLTALVFERVWNDSRYTVHQSRAGQA